MLKRAIVGPLQRYLGIEWSQVSQVEKLVSALGGFLGILSILLISGPYLHEPEGALIVASMGASAVLLFVVPHGPLSQPWALTGGHLVSAFIGVSCAILVPDTMVAAALFNYFFRWRRYPVALSRPLQREAPDHERPPIDHQDLVLALSELDTYTDISEQDLVKIYELAYTTGHEEPLPTDALETGNSYSNGRHGAEWQVREITAVEDAGNSRQVVVFRIVAGDGAGRGGKAGLMEFARWARYRVVRTDNLWQRV